MRKSPNSLRFYIFWLWLVCSASSCTIINPTHDLSSHKPQGFFDYSSYGHLLDMYANDQGRINYFELKKNSAPLDFFYSQIAASSPDSHPHLFPNNEDRLAYWINAYNATVIKGVIEHYPITSVEDVAEPPLLFFFPTKSGFFFFQQFVYGAETYSLYTLENTIIRKRFDDPRYHFALNCASLSCPQLPSEPFYPEKLEEQLAFETKKFMRSSENVHFDSDTNVLHLSSIFKWYQEDFLVWLKKQHNLKRPLIIDYILPYLPADLAAQIQKKHDSITIRYTPYDWGLNDQK